MKIKTSKNFIIGFYDEDLNIVDRVVKNLEENLDNVLDFFNYNLSDKIKVNIYPNKETFKNELHIENYQNWMVGRGGKQISIVSPQNAITHSFDAMLKVSLHELVHLINRLALTVEKEIPKWLTEGVASYLSGQFPTQEYLNNKLESTSFPKLHVLCAAEDFKTNNGYSFAQIYVKDIVSKYGKQYFLNCFGDLKKLEDVTNNNFEETAIKNYISKISLPDKAVNCVDKAKSESKILVTNTTSDKKTTNNKN